MDRRSALVDARFPPDAKPWGDVPVRWKRVCHLWNLEGRVWPELPLKSHARSHRYVGPRHPLVLNEQREIARGVGRRWVSVALGVRGGHAKRKRLNSRHRRRQYARYGRQRREDVPAAEVQRQ